MSGGFYLASPSFWTLLLSFWASTLLVFLLLPDCSSLSVSSLFLLCVAPIRWPQGCLRHLCSHVHTLSASTGSDITSQRPSPGWQTRLSNRLLNSAGPKRFGLVPPPLCSPLSPQCANWEVGAHFDFPLTHPSPFSYQPPDPTKSPSQISCHHQMSRRPRRSAILEGPTAGVFSQPHSLLC